MIYWSFRNDRRRMGQRPYVMGIVNVTPDSFSDGGQFNSAERAIEHGLQLANEGADFLDVGGESTRPNAEPVSLEEELTRVIPVVKGLAQNCQVPISVDTTKAEVARQAMAAGASIINDISAGLFEPEILEVVRDTSAGYVLMHMQGTPKTMQLNPAYDDVVNDIVKFLGERLTVAKQVGIDPRRIALDPGIGFGKTFVQTMSQLQNLNRLAVYNRPVLLGVSRKGFIGEVTGRPRSERVFGSVAVACYATGIGKAHLWRVHDVAAHVDAAKIIGAINQGHL
jgi:dihydropteroate synthase